MNPGKQMRRRMRAWSALGGAVFAFGALSWAGFVSAQPSGVAPKRAGSASAKPEPGSEWVYTVAEGDTLRKLTKRYTVPPASWGKLQKLNRVADPKRIPVGSQLRFPIPWLKTDEAVAKVAYVQGGVTAQRAGVDLPTLVLGSELRPGDQVRTAVGASVTLRFVDGSRVLIVPDSRVTIDSMLVYGASKAQETRLRVEQGGVESRVNPMPIAGSRYEIRTPTVSLGVRGTDFQVRFDPTLNTARTEVLEGRVLAANDRAAVDLPGGFGAAVKANEAPSARELLPAPDPKGMLDRHERVPLKMSWQMVPGSSGYRVQVFGDAAQERLLVDARSDQATLRLGDLPDGSYVVRVRAVDAVGLEGKATVVPFVVKARPEPPFPGAPQDQSKSYGPAALFKWTRNPEAERYRFQLAQRPDFASLLADDARLTAPEVSVNLLPGDYHWRVASIAKGDDQGPFSDPSTFTQKPIPESPVMDAPGVKDGAVTLRWKSREPGQTFHYQIGATADFSKLVAEKSTAEPLAAFAKPPPGTYFLRVRTTDADGYAGPYGTAQEITIEADPPKSRPWTDVLPLLVLLLLL